MKTLKTQKEEAENEIVTLRNRVKVIEFSTDREKEYEDIQVSYEVGAELIKRINKNFKTDLISEPGILMEARLRTGSNDRLPLAGKIEENVYALGALGSRGFSLGPILGEHIASLINNTPSPISSGIAIAIEPLRFKD